MGKPGERWGFWNPGPKKCKLMQRKVKYVGHICSEQGVETDPEKTEKVVKWPVPKNAEEVRQFTSFAGY